MDNVGGQEATTASVTVLVVNYKTLELTRRCLDTLLAHYPMIPLLVIDNGSKDASTEFLRALPCGHENVQVVLNKRNVHHGPALDQGIRLVGSRFVFTLDSDCEILRPGFIEAMLGEFDDPRLYALGELRFKNRFGYTYAYWDADGSTHAAWIPYVHPYAMLVDRRKYLDLAPFVHHGAPCIKNMQSAKAAGYRVRHFPIYDFVRHHHGGTSISHGFGLIGRIQLAARSYLSKLYDRMIGERALEVRYPAAADEEERGRGAL